MASSSLAPTLRSLDFSFPLALMARSRLWLEYQEKFSAFHYRSAKIDLRIEDIHHHPYHPCSEDYKPIDYH